MKNLMILAFIAMPLLSTSQKRDTTLYKAGVELIKYDKQYTTGTFMQFAGGILIALGSASKTDAAQPVTIGGGALAVIGFIMQLTASSHIKRAGVYLTKNKIVIPL